MTNEQLKICMLMWAFDHKDYASELRSIQALGMDVTYTRVRTIIERQMKEFTHTALPSTGPQNAGFLGLQGKPQWKKGGYGAQKKCGRCGGQHHNDACPFKNKECHGCGKTGHIQKMWRSTGKARGNQGPKKSGDLRAVSISSDGGTVAIGAHLNDGAGSDAGHVRVYRFDGITWRQMGDDIDGEAAGDWFGQAVSLSSDGEGRGFVNLC